MNSNLNKKEIKNKEIKNEAAALAELLKENRNEGIKTIKTKIVELKLSNANRKSELEIEIEVIEQEKNKKLKGYLEISEQIKKTRDGAEDLIGYFTHQDKLLDPKIFEEMDNKIEINNVEIDKLKDFPEIVGHTSTKLNKKIINYKRIGYPRFKEYCDMCLEINIQVRKDMKWLEKYIDLKIQSISREFDTKTENIEENKKDIDKEFETSKRGIFREQAKKNIEELIGFCQYVKKDHAKTDQLDIDLNKALEYFSIHGYIDNDLLNNIDYETLESKIADYINRGVISNNFTYKFTLAVREVVKKEDKSHLVLIVSQEDYNDEKNNKNKEKNSYRKQIIEGIVGENWIDRILDRNSQLCQIDSNSFGEYAKKLNGVIKYLKASGRINEINPKLNRTSFISLKDLEKLETILKNSQGIGENKPEDKVCINNKEYYRENIHMFINAFRPKTKKYLGTNRIPYEFMRNNVNSLAVDHYFKGFDRYLNMLIKEGAILKTGNGKAYSLAANADEIKDENLKKIIADYLR